MRETTHYIGDGCPGGHVELRPLPGAPPDVDHAQLLGQIAAIVHQQSTMATWADRGAWVRTTLCAAGIHNGQLDPLGVPVQSDWRACPVCSMHPERHAGEPS